MSAALTQFLQLLVKQKGSDLHIAANSPPMLRINGDLAKIDVPPLTPKDVDSLFNDVLSDSQKEVLKYERQIDFALKISGVGVFRGNVFYQRFGLSAVFRALSENAPTIEQLRLPAICRTACSYPNGLVLVTGPTGSGKSTTLAAMINYINMTSRGHILTLEDPIEFQHVTKKCMINQRQLGEHFTDFKNALKAALREDPDVILVGEMRDYETIGLAITAAETGHLVFATLHTNTAAKSVDRMIDSFPSDQQSQIRSMLSESLRAVISQKLVPSADKKGRIAVHDVLVVNSAVANLVREGKTFQIPSIMQTSRKDGMQVMDNVILDHVRASTIAGPVGWEYANDKSLFAQWAPTEAVPGTQAGAQPTSASGMGNNPMNPQRPGMQPLNPLKKTG